MIFFDLDNTLLDHDGAEDVAARAFCAAHAQVLGASGAAFVERWRALTAKHFDRYLAGEISHVQQRRARLAELFGDSGLVLSEQELDTRFALYLTAYRAHWRPYDDVVDALDALGAHPLGVITNGDATQQREKLQHLGLSERFAIVLTPDVCGAAKPSPHIFLEAARLAGCAPATCVYVGDHPDTDARAARAAGMRGVWLDRAGKAPAACDVEVITTLAALPALIGTE
jgi:putative hydrolase of the HAD superfamily